MPAEGSEQATSSSLALAEVEAELPTLRARAERAGWATNFDPERLSLDIKIVHKSTGEPFLLRGKFERYRSLPPIWEFVDVDTGEEGTRAAYPCPVPPAENPNRVSPIIIENGSKGPVICLPCNRLAYREFDGRAPHQDWRLVNWTNQEPKCTTIAEMVSRIVQDIQLSKGRWAPRPTKVG